MHVRNLKIPGPKFRVRRGLVDIHIIFEYIGETQRSEVDVLFFTSKVVLPSYLSGTEKKEGVCVVKLSLCS